MMLRSEDKSSPRRQLDGVRKEALETGRNRLLVTGLVMTMAFAVVAFRLIDLAAMPPEEPAATADNAQVSTEPVVGRADIVDRNGLLLATSLPTASLYADPKGIIDAKQAAAKLVTVLPDLNEKEVLHKLEGPGRFVWIKRNLSPHKQYEVNRLGIPGLDFQRDERRVYPHGALAAHVLGVTDIDENGISGIERYFDKRLRSSSKPLRLSIDLRVEAVMHEELQKAMTKFSAKGAAGIVLNCNTGEILAMVSLPDFNPNIQGQILGNAGFNRATKGVYEMGSTFKLFTAAMALDSGTVTLNSGYDASKPLHVARFTISDYHAQNRWLSVPEIIIHSSNIGAAKMAADVGVDMQRAYLKRFGMLDPLKVQIPEIGAPLTPKVWRLINTMTIAFGHGIAVSPLQLVDGIATLVNGGIRREPTLLALPKGDVPPGTRVLKAETSREVRGLMRLVVSAGTGRKADAKGYFVGGKTGTAEQEVHGVYKQKRLLSSFVGAYPMDHPRFVVFAMLDEPHGIKQTFNYATGGWVAAPVVKRVIERTAPMLGIAPDKAAPDIQFKKGAPPTATVNLALERVPPMPQVPMQAALQMLAQQPSPTQTANAKPTATTSAATLAAQVAAATRPVKKRPTATRTASARSTKARPKATQTASARPAASQPARRTAMAIPATAAQVADASAGQSRIDRLAQQTRQALQQAYVAQ